MKKQNKRKKGSLGLIIALIMTFLILAGVAGLAVYTLLYGTRDAGQVRTVPETVSVKPTVESVRSEPERAESAGRPDSADSREKRLLEASVHDPSFWNGAPTITKDFLTVNPYSRPGTKLDGVEDIVIHYVGNAGSTAKENRDYFESLMDGSRSASAHFVVGLKGEILQCIPTDEWSYATKWRNHDTISIEVCHPGEDGKFNDASYDSAVDLTAFLCKAFEIGPGHVIRHYDVTGKLCPKYYVEHEDAWKSFLADVRTRYDLIASPPAESEQENGETG